jgi:hypothetical protein
MELQMPSWHVSKASYADKGIDSLKRAGSITICNCVLDGLVNLQYIDGESESDKKQQDGGGQRDIRNIQFFK